MKLHFSWTCILLLLISACSESNPEQAENILGTSFKGEITRLESELDRFVMPEAKVELLAEGYDWSEGPLWLPSEQKLIWSDVPRNTIYQWTEAEGASEYLKPSGSTGTSSESSSEGSNGLLLNAAGNLILCQHGDRRVAIMQAPLSSPEANFITLADTWQGKRFNSPNDAAIGPDAAIYFTDPPYGLKKQADDPGREIAFFGVYKIDRTGEVSLMDSSLTRPNGIAFSPDMKRCFVANSDPEKAIWMVYDVNEQGDLENGKVFFDATDMVPQKKGLPDGLKVNSEGIVFATGPGGVLVFSPEGKHLGTIATGQAIANCAFNEDESVLFLTSDMYLASIRIKESTIAFRHMVYLNIKPDMDSIQMNTLMSQLERLGSIPGVIDYHIGTFKDLGDQRAFSEYELMIGMDFRNRHDYENYQKHPTHLEVKKALKDYLEAAPGAYDVSL